MRLSFFIPIVFWLAACTGEIGFGDGDGDGGTTADGGLVPDGGTDLGQGEPTSLSGITAAHNTVRSGVDIPLLRWDDELAVVAQTWADRCVDNEAPTGLVDHNAGRSDNYPGYVGENIYGSGGAPSASQAVNLWAAEVADYDYDSNSCSGVCGHYTQIVWATSQRLGCGVSNCPGLQFGGTIVCNYSPGGNIGGMRPY